MVFSPNHINDRDIPHLIGNFNPTQKWGTKNVISTQPMKLG